MKNDKKDIPCCYLREDGICGVCYPREQAQCPCVDYAVTDPMIEMRKHQEYLISLGVNPVTHREKSQSLLVFAIATGIFNLLMILFIMIGIFTT